MSERHAIGSVADFEANKPRRFVLDGEEVMVVKIDDEFFAVNDVCTHGEVSLSEGEIIGCSVECWLHGSAFDLRTGKPSGPPATKAIETYSVSLEGDENNPTVYVSLEAGR